VKDDSELLASIRNGALDDFTGIVQRHQARVFAILSRYERDPHKVEDLAQETFLKAWRALGRFDSDRAPFEHWLARIAVRVALDHLRRERRTADEVKLSELGESALEWLHNERDESQPDAADAREILELAMSCLSAEERLVLTLREIEGRNAKEISQLTGWSGVSVRVRAYRARAKLREALTRLEKGTT
jgi:RNA polymerase sigma-70 factor (ECF subfamily)